MVKKKIGKSGIEVSPIGLGCWPIGGEMYVWGTPDAYSNIDDKESIRAINAGIDNGINFFDTADCYGAGHSEKILSKVLKKRRSEVVIATKFGYVFDEKTKNIHAEDNSPEYIKKACKESLKRLGIDYIDLYQFHVGFIKKEEALAAIGALEELKEEGLIREIGWSTWDEEAITLFPEKLATIQHVSNVFSPNNQLIDLCKDNDLISLNNSPMAMGLLGGKYKPGDKIPKGDVRASGFDWVPYFKNGEPNQEYYTKLESIREILRSNGRTLAQGALAYVMAQSDNTIPIPGFRTVKQAVDNAKAIELGPLTNNQVKEINNLLK